VVYPLDEVLLFCLLAVLGGAETFVDIARFGEKTINLMRRFRPPIHMVSAFAARQRLVLGQIKVADKSNEIVAIPALLAMMPIEGAIVTIDAMGRQAQDCPANLVVRRPNTSSRDCQRSTFRIFQVQSSPHRGFRGPRCS
jgi:hypothetical protein